MFFSFLCFYFIFGRAQGVSLILILVRANFDYKGNTKQKAAVYRWQSLTKI